MSLQFKDIEKSIADAGNPDVSESEYKRIKSELLNVLTVLDPPNTYIQKVQAALSILENNRPVTISWYQKPSGLILIAACGGVLTYAVLLAFGWVSLPNN